MREARRSLQKTHLPSKRELNLRAEAAERRPESGAHGRGERLIFPMNGELGAGADGVMTKKLRHVAAALVAKAMAGDVQAIREINDRVDGKVPQALGGEGDQGPVKQVLEVVWLGRLKGEIAVERRPLL